MNYTIESIREIEVEVGVTEFIVEIKYPDIEGNFNITVETNAKVAYKEGEGDTSVLMDNSSLENLLGKLEGLIEESPIGYDGDTMIALHRALASILKGDVEEEKVVGISSNIGSARYVVHTNTGKDYYVFEVSVYETDTDTEVQEEDLEELLNKVSDFIVDNFKNTLEFQYINTHSHLKQILRKDQGEENKTERQIGVNIVKKEIIDKDRIISDTIEKNKDNTSEVTLKEIKEDLIYITENVLKASKKRNKKVDKKIRNLEGEVRFLRSLVEELITNIHKSSLKERDKLLTEGTSREVERSNERNDLLVGGARYPFSNPSTYPFNNCMNTYDKKEENLGENQKEPIRRYGFDKEELNRIIVKED